MAHSSQQAAIQERFDEEVAAEEEVEDVAPVNTQAEAKPKDIQDEVRSIAIIEPVPEEVVTPDASTPQSEHSDLQRSLVRLGCDPHVSTY